MMKFIFYLVTLMCISCVTSKKSAQYDSVVEKPKSVKKDMLGTIRNMANLDKDDFTFISEKMKNVVEHYKILQEKLSTLENKIDRLIAHKSVSPSHEAAGSKIEIETEEIPSDISNPSNSNVLVDTVEEKPATKATPNLMFLAAKKLYSQKSWQSAISQFQEYLDANPKGLYSIEATYYIGESFRNLKMIPEAQVFYEEIAKSYPQSLWAAKAKQHLNKQ